MSSEGKNKIEEILERYAFPPESLIGILLEVQRVENYLPREKLEYLSWRMNVPLARIYQIATFYKSFSLKPMGRHRIKVCTGTACHLKGASRNAEEIMRRLVIGPGETTEDLSFSMETVNCLGTCALAPVIVVDGEYYDSVSPVKVRKVLDRYILGK